MSLLEAHERLAREFHENQNSILLNPDYRNAFFKRFDELAGRLREFARGGRRSTETFEWLNHVATEWQVALSSILREPRDLREQIVGLSLPDMEYSCLLSEEEVYRYLQSKAYQIGQERKLGRLFEQYLELKHHRARIHENIPSTPKEREKDWYTAEVCFATEVLDGRISFVRQIAPECYPRLENVWVEDVKRMKAYLIWEKSGMPFEEDGGKREYWQACDELRQFAMQASAKASLASFEQVRLYVEQLYLSGEEVDASHDSSAHALIARKALRLWELEKPQNREKETWAAAERYVRGFYENIIPAVLGTNPEDIQTALEAFCNAHGASRPNYIANAFEAAIVFHFLSPELLGRYCGSDACHLL